jgi:hypothetical protein
VTTTQELLGRWKARQGHANDSEAARALGVRPSAVNHWKQGNAHANPVAAARMAEDLGLDVLSILASIEADRAHDGDTRRVWARFGKGAFMALVVAAATASGPVRATTTSVSMNGTAHYANSRRRPYQTAPEASPGGPM